MQTFVLWQLLRLTYIYAAAAAAEITSKQTSIPKYPQEVQNVYRDTQSIVLLTSRFF